MKKKLAIIGAGIAGLTLANFIKKYYISINLHYIKFIIGIKYILNYIFNITHNNCWKIL